MCQNRGPVRPGSRTSRARTLLSAPQNFVLIWEINRDTNITFLVLSLISYKFIAIYKVIQNKRAKIKQDIGDAPLNNLR